MADLNRVQQSSLIALYREHAVLWDVNLPAYKDANARLKALKTMQASFHQQWGVRLEIQNIKNKLQNFRQAISRENAKIERHVKNMADDDEAYVPVYSHWNELQFLQPFLRKREPKPDLSQSPSQSEEGKDSLCWILPSSHRQDPLNILPRPLSVTPEPVPTQDCASSSQSAASTPVRPSTPIKPTPVRLATPPGSPPEMPQGRPTQPSSSSRKRQDTDEDVTLNPFVPSIPSCPAGDAGHKWVNRTVTLPDYVQSKKAKIQTETTQEDPYMIWAKNLVQDLKKVEGENKRTVLQIKINRLVQDEILKQLTGSSDPTE